jgi:prevent-host-death family protein
MNFHRKTLSRTFSTAELSRKIGDVTHAASEAPVTITHHNKPRYVMMTVETFERLNPQRAYRTDETPDEVADWLLPALENIAAGNFDYEE